MYEFGASGGIFNVLMDAVFTQKSTGVVHNRNFVFATIAVNYPVPQVIESSYITGGFINYNLSNPSIGDMVGREISIQNGGTSRLDSVFFNSNFSTSLNVLSYSLGTAVSLQLI